MKTEKTRIIAEAASNHGGNTELALEFIRAAAACGADAVKFQSSRFEDLIDPEDVQAEWVRRSSLNDDQHVRLVEECRREGIDFITTCFSRSRIPFLSTLGIREIKVASPDLLSFRMIEELASHFEHLVISVGMHTLHEVSSAVDFLREKNIRATLLHATSLYPTPLDKAFMRRFDWLRERYEHVGYSNHVPDPAPMLYAVSRGAEIVETHFKLADSGKGRAAPFDVSLDTLKSVCEFRDRVAVLRGSRECLEEDFLLPEEVKARERFIGRFGDNR